MMMMVMMVRMNLAVYAVLVDDLGERGAHYIATRDLMRKMYTR